MTEELTLLQQAIRRMHSRLQFDTDSNARMLGSMASPLSKVATPLVERKSTKRARMFFVPRFFIPLARGRHKKSIVLLPTYTMLIIRIQRNAVT
jgi:hypothetical protein